MTLRAAPWLPLMLCAALAACASRPPVPDWQGSAQGAAQRATAAYLAGEDRVAQAEWARARAEVARTGRPDLLARLADAANLLQQPELAVQRMRALLDVYGVQQTSGT